MRTPLIAGNPKMNLTGKDLSVLLTALKNEQASGVWKADVVYCPPFTLLRQAEEILRGGGIGLGAQNMHWESSGAFTGETSAAMLAEVGCRFVILGHSERRALFGETDAMVARKARSAMTVGLVPILCVGETKEERDSGNTLSVLSRQISGSTAGLQPESPANLILAYEPVWAIGTGQNATPDQAQEAHAHLRTELKNRLGETLAEGIRIIYGGSVKPANSSSLLACPDIDGALVGGASLEATSFVGIIHAA